MFTKLKLGIAIGALVVAFGSGWGVRDAFCDAKEAKALLASERARVKALEDNIAKIAAAHKADAARAETNAAEIERLEGIIRDTEAKITAGECFSADDAERVRSLWQ